jgi:DNA-damage-inducible protein J
MNTAVINIKTNPEVKEQAQRIASELGFSLSSLLNGYMRHLIKTKTVYFSAKSEEPSEYLIEVLKESEADRKAGRVSPSFDKVNDAIAWLKNPKKKYLNES